MNLPMITETKYMRKIFLFLILSSGSLFLMQCNPKDSSPQTEQTWEEPAKRVDISYHLISQKGEGKNAYDSLDANQKKVVAAINRVDEANISNLDTLVIPNAFAADYMQYSPFPFGVKEFRQIRKIIFFSYPAQAFGAYEYGRLVKWGPTSLGKESAQTPTGLFYANWKAEETISTVDDEWKLKWNFNIANKEGVGWHQYAMPGYPASHSCLRLYEDDAKYLYSWADQWILEGTDNIKAQGTPTIVFGNYPFGQAKPWWQLASNGKALNISEKELSSLVTPHLQEILAEQQKQAELKSTE